MTCQFQMDGMLEVVYFHEQHNHEFAYFPMKHMLKVKNKNYTCLESYCR